MYYWKTKTENKKKFTLTRYTFKALSYRFINPLRKRLMKNIRLYANYSGSDKILVDMSN